MNSSFWRPAHRPLPSPKRCRYIKLPGPALHVTPSLSAGGKSEGDNQGWQLPSPSSYFQLLAASLMVTSLAFVYLSSLMSVFK